jgi:hypothetical protein
MSAPKTLDCTGSLGNPPLSSHPSPLKATQPNQPAQPPYPYKPPIPIQPTHLYCLTKKSMFLPTYILDRSCYLQYQLQVVGHTFFITGDADFVAFFVFMENAP